MAKNWYNQDWRESDDRLCERGDMDASEIREYRSRKMVYGRNYIAPYRDGKRVDQMTGKVIEE